jgi:iron(III) transport system ATP-binding protein
MTALEFRDVTRRFDANTAVNGVSLEIQTGEFYSLLGPSGSGKSTLLRIAAGLERPDRGSVVLDGRDITSLPPQDRGIGLVFQNYALFPQMTVAENVGFGLKVRGVQGQDLHRRVQEALTRVDLRDKERASVALLSGGEQQRVAVARALVIQPKLLLFDEPLSNLDVTLRQRTRAEIRSLQKRTGITTLYVTHDQAEALSISDRIAVLHGGSVEQVGTPQDLYCRPATEFVARFLGWENAFDGALDSAKGCVRLHDLPVEFSPGDLPPGPDDVLVLFSAEMVSVGSDENTEAVRGIIEAIDFRGGSSVLTVRVGTALVHCAVTGAQARLSWREGQPVALRFELSSARVFPGTRS